MTGALAAVINVQQRQYIHLVKRGDDDDRGRSRFRTGSDDRDDSRSQSRGGDDGSDDSSSAAAVSPSSPAPTVGGAAGAGSIRLFNSCNFQGPSRTIGVGKRQQNEFEFSSFSAPAGFEVVVWTDDDCEDDRNAFTQSVGCLPNDLAGKIKCISVNPLTGA
jgi:hypothetical protein